MYISKELKWLKPYFEDAKPMFPKLKVLKKTTVVQGSYTKKDRMSGQITELEKGFGITIRTCYQHIDFYPLQVTLLPLSKVDILTTFAHELAHIYFWKHSPEHKILECQILTMFMFKLKNSKYKDEETELGGVQ